MFIAQFFKASSLKKVVWELNLKGTVVNPAFPSLPGGSLEITLTVPLRTENYDIVPKICVKDVNPCLCHIFVQPLKEKRIKFHRNFFS